MIKFFQQIVISLKDCADKAREEGGVLRKSRCLEVGCCWDAAFSDSPWCYLSAVPMENVPVETVPLETVPFDGTSDDTPPLSQSFKLSSTSVSLRVFRANRI